MPSRTGASPLRFPGIGARLHGRIVRDDLRFGFPFLSWDAWMVLHHIAREALVHNKDGSIPARWLKPLEQHLVPLPEWAGFDTSAVGRVVRAATLLHTLKLVESPKGRLSHNLRISSSGTEILKQGRAVFFARAMEFKGLASVDPSQGRLAPSAEENVRIACWRMGREIEEFEGLGRRLAERVLEALPLAGSVRMSDMESAFAPSDPHVFVRGVPRAERRVDVSSETFFDRVDTAMARIMMVDALAVPYCLGLVARGITAGGEITWGLTEAGRRWLGSPSDTHPAPPRHVKVTPAYDIFFGRVDPAALAEMSIYCELSGHDHGMVAKLSRQGVRSALALGVSVQDIVASLDGIVASPLPTNVRHALDDWGRGAQPVQVREGVVLQCPDSPTADTLERLGKGSVERLSDTILLLPDRKALTGLRAKAGGIGVLL